MSKCCGEEMKEISDYEFIEPDADCIKCGGTGESYLSDGVYGECECVHGCGDIVKTKECQICYSYEAVN